MDDEKRLAPRILLVEDSMIIALDAEESLLQLGAQSVTVHATVAGALAALDGASFDVAVLDHNLGDESSAPVAQELRARGIPFWLATGYSEMADTLDEIGARGLLVKPYGKEELAQVLRAYQEVRDN
jgi:CheY-like chemotaxis protein